MSKDICQNFDTNVKIRQMLNDFGNLSSTSITFL